MNAIENPDLVCSLCFVGGRLPGDIEYVGHAWRCIDRVACTERIWRVEAKKLDAIREDEMMQSRRPLEPLLYKHHYEDCDYRNGAWICAWICQKT